MRTIIAAISLTALAAPAFAAYCSEPYPRFITEEVTRIAMANGGALCSQRPVGNKVAVSCIVVTQTMIVMWESQEIGADWRVCDYVVVDKENSRMILNN
jgi:hypothetical protein